MADVLLVMVRLGVEVGKVGEQQHDREQQPVEGPRADPGEERLLVPLPALGPLAEQQLRRALSISQGDWSVLVQSPVAAVLLTGGLWFAADLTRALSRLGRNVRFDALWLASYGDEQTSRGRIEVRAPYQRSLDGRKVLILDDVFDTGLSLAEAARRS